MTPRAEFGRLCGTATLALCALAAAGCGKTTAVDLSQYDTGAQGFAVGGTVEGLVGSGLVLRNLGADDLHVSGNGAFSFATRQATGATFRVTVGVQPTGPAQTCAVSSGSGIVGTANVIDILVKCVNAEPVTMTGAITGLTGTGLVLQMNGADDLAVASTSTSFTFATQLPKGTPYALTIKKQPSNPLQTCTVTNGTGLVGLGGDLSLSCSVNPSFSISGTISGYVGSGLVLAQGTETLAIAPSSTTFALVNPVQEGARWFVQVRTQPSAPRQTCVVSTPAGTMGSAPITDLVITCTTNATFKLGGVVQGLQGTGLVLKTDLGDTVAPAADGTFSFPQKLQSATPYTITVAQQPVGPAQTCTIEGDTGVVGSADVTDVRVECLTDPYYAIGGTLTGLAGVRVILQNEGADDLELDFDGPVPLATTAQRGTPFPVAVRTQRADPR
ncbi:MAG: hypothetical protein JST92_08495, partial [Deltaproteobacteria bacterium]|nr:hypothetical protein [Deltaproteobacteria bacterium]